MENCLDLAIRTGRAVGSVALTIDNYPVSSFISSGNNRALAAKNRIPDYIVRCAEIIVPLRLRMVFRLHLHVMRHLVFHLLTGIPHRELGTNQQLEQFLVRHFGVR